MNASDKKILIVGLGNPGKEYGNTRHNVGFMVIDALIDELRITNYELRKKCNAEIFMSTKPISNVQYPISLILAKPQNYMNNSGVAVSALARFYKIQSPDLWVVYDDMYLPLGKLRIRESGGSGGHKGAQSIIDDIGTKEFPRFRIGIGQLPRNSDPAVFVLKPFLKTELVKMQLTLQTTVKAFYYALDYGIKKTMSRFNSL